MNRLLNAFCWGILAFFVILLGLYAALDPQPAGGDADGDAGFDGPLLGPPVRGVSQDRFPEDDGEQARSPPASAREADDPKDEAEARGDGKEGKGDRDGKHGDGRRKSWKDDGRSGDDGGDDDWDDGEDDGDD